MIQSTPASPYDQRRLPTSSDMNGLAESLIGGVSNNLIKNIICKKGYIQDQDNIYIN